MIGSRTLTAIVVGAASVLLSIGLYLYTGSLLFFLLIPFVPFFFAGRESEASETAAETVFRCSRCEFRTTNPEFEYCPRDGSRLYERDDGRSEY